MIKDPPAGRGVLGPKRSESLLALGSLLMLALLSYYTWVFTQLTSLEFQFDNDTWLVGETSRPCEGNCLQGGDRLVSINGVTLEEYSSSLISTPVDWTGPLDIEIEREGQRLDLRIDKSPLPLYEFLSIYVAVLVPALFWLMGTIALIFVRPRDERWLVLVLFCFTTALWIAAGLVSHTQIGWSVIVLHSLLWLFLPLIVHLHLVLPTTPFPRVRRALPVLYVAAAIGLALDLTKVLPHGIFAVPVILGLFAALVIVVVRQFLPGPPAVRVAHRLMLFGVLAGTLPLVTVIVILWWDPLQTLPLDIGNLTVAFAGLLSIPNWPLTYLYAIYKHDLGSIQIRANRFLGTYSFLSLYMVSYVAAMIFGQDMLLQHPVVFTLAISLVFVGLAPLLQRRFQTLLDRVVFGIRYKPNDVVGLFAQRIPSAFDRNRLRRLIVGEILPTLMVRESALYFFDHDKAEQVYQQGLSPSFRVRHAGHLAQVMKFSGQYIASGVVSDPRFAWVRLVIPLSIEDQPIGVWLLGRRDPDDFYPRSDISLLTNLANQIATVVRAQVEIRENKDLQQQLLHAQKMEAIGRLSAGISHDFNNLLSAIVGYGNLLLERHRGDNTSQRYLTGILDAGRKAETLTTQLLSFSRRDVTDATVVDISSLVRRLQGLLDRLLSDEIELVLAIEAEGNVLIDPNRFEQALLNLVVNAGDAMPEGGRLTIITEDFRCGSSFSLPHPHTDLEPGTYVHMRVVDTGVGIDPRVEPHIFEPFFTTKEIGKGTGLGLATTYGIVHQSGGRLYVESEPGRGTTFHLMLPAVAAPTVHHDVMAEMAKTVESSGGSETILVAEDDEMVRTVVVEVLRARDYEVLEAVDGRDALTLAEAREAPIDLLLSDVMMPQMRGPELAQRLRRIRPEIRIVFMSGYNDETVFDGYDRKNLPPLLQKPFTPAALLECVREALLRDRPRSVSKA